MSEQTCEPSVTTPAEDDLSILNERLVTIGGAGERVEVLRKTACCAASNTFRWRRFPTAIFAGTGTATNCQVWVSHQRTAKRQ